MNQNLKKILLLVIVGFFVWVDVAPQPAEACGVGGVSWFGGASRRRARRLARQGGDAASQARTAHLQTCEREAAQCREHMDHIREEFPLLAARFGYSYCWEDRDICMGRSRESAGHDQMTAVLQEYESCIVKFEGSELDACLDQVIESVQNPQ